MMTNKGLQQGSRVRIAKHDSPDWGSHGTIIGKRGNLWKVAIDGVDSVLESHLFYGYELRILRTR